MDRLIYTAMTGAKHTFLQQAGVAHNLANATTTGYRAQEHRFRAVPVQADGTLPTRAFVVDASVSDNFDQGPMSYTGRSLDVAVQGSGWITVQLPDGSEAYTRNGNFQVNANGQLQTKSGINVMGDGGPLTVPPDNMIAIAPDGTVSAIPSYGTPNTVNAVGTIKLVNPPTADLVRGDDGLFRLKSGQPAPTDTNVRLASETLEGSNVNVVDAMVSLISLSRQFEMQTKMISSAEANDQAAARVMSLT